MACLVGLDFIRSRLSGELLEVLALSLELCLSCGGRLVSRDGEVVCSRCGLVWSVENSADHVPFPEAMKCEWVCLGVLGVFYEGRVLAFPNFV
jgi:hypothetical protein